VSAALAQSVLLALTGIASVGQILVVLVLLAGKRGTDGNTSGFRNAVAYSGGMTGALFVIGALVLLMGAQGSTSGPSGERELIAAWLATILGVLLLGLGLRTARRPQRAEPSLLAKLDAASAGRLFAIGVMVGCVNIKNLGLYIAAVDVLVLADLSPGESVVSLIIVTIVFCSCLFIPLVGYTLGGAAGRRLLTRLRGNLERRYKAVSVGILMIFGTLFLVRGASVLLS
jgi:threonine/homoserine/homoserine lactone efflux protein